MTISVQLSDEVEARLEALAARCTLSAAEIVVDALENGRSLSWYEHFLDDVDAGMADADRGDFASDDEIARLLGKHRAA
jgi:predicted transcriptional regulator